MKLIIISGNYPHKIGGDFLNNEVWILSKYFDEILLISDSKKNKFVDIYNLPNNVKFITINRYYHYKECLIKAFIKIFSIETIIELIYASNTLNIKINFNAIKKIAIYYMTYYRLLIWVKSNVIKNDSDVIFYSYWLSESAYALSKLKKQKFIFKAISRAHGGDAFLDREYNPFRRENYKYLDQIHFVSEKALIQFTKNIILPNASTKAKLYTSYLGTINDELAVNPTTKCKNSFIIVSCSNIIPLKRLDLIVDSLSKIKNHNIKWIHFGDGEYKNVIFNLVNEKLLNLNNIYEVEFKGQVNNEEILNYYKLFHVDLFINVSDYEGIPVSIMEALSFGIPVIAKNIGGNSEIIFDNINGYLLDKNITSIELSKKINKFINLKSKTIYNFRKNAYQIWKNNFNAKYNYINFAKEIKTI